MAELIRDLELVYDSPMKDYCGTCTRCIDACPTEAIAPQGYLVDASKCISYLTIELKEAIPDEFAGKMIRIRFQAGFDGATGILNGYTGWYIDNLKLTADIAECR